MIKIQNYVFSLILLTSFINGCFTNTIVPSGSCELYGKLIYNENRQIITEQEAKEFFLNNKANGKLGNLDLHGIKEVEKMIFIETKNYKNEYLEGWLPSPYGLLVGKYNNIEGMLVTKDGKIYSFGSCE